MDDVVNKYVAELNLMTDTLDVGSKTALLAAYPKIVGHLIDNDLFGKYRPGFVSELEIAGPEAVRKIQIIVAPTEVEGPDPVPAFGVTHTVAPDQVLARFHCPHCHRKMRVSAAWSPAVCIVK